MLKVQSAMLGDFEFVSFLYMCLEFLADAFVQLKFHDIWTKDETKPNMAGRYSSTLLLSLLSAPLKGHFVGIFMEVFFNHWRNKYVHIFYVKIKWRNDI